MAEFQDVMRQWARMCRSMSIYSACPLHHAGYKCETMPMEGFDSIEKIIMDWAAEHPKLRYPTWKEWQNQNFPDAEIDICAQFFSGDICQSYKDCIECRAQSIPADIAQKLGIKPIE